MNFFICNFILFLSFLIPLSYPCGPFNCKRFSNRVHLTFNIRPNLKLTFNTNATTRHRDQYCDLGSLKKRLVKMVSNTINRLRIQHKVNRKQVSDVVRIHRKSRFISATYQRNVCIYDCSYRHTYAPAGTYYHDGNVLKRRLTDGICLDGNVVGENGKPAVVHIVFAIRVRVVDKRVFCFNHWKVLSKRIRKNLHKHKFGVVIGKVRTTKG